MDDKYKKELKHQNKDNKKNSKDEIVEELKENYELGKEYYENIIKAQEK